MSLGFEQALEEAARTAERSFPGLGVDRAAFVERLRGRFAASTDPVAALSAAHVDGLYLAFACTCGIAAAIARVDDELSGQARATSARFRLPTDAIDELIQRVRERLFVAAPTRRSRLDDYDGRGELGAYVRAIMVHMALDDLRRRGRALSDEDTLAELAAPDDDLRVAHMKREYAAEFRAALREAITMLDREARIDLKLYYLDGVTLESLAAMHGVVASTIARRLARTRETLFARTRDLVAARLALGPEDLDSLLALVASRIEVARSALESKPR
jgi:RNA polymerase sigma-70 factor (ECF subfamily)